MSALTAARRVVVVLALVAAATACDDVRRQGIGIENDTQETLTFEVLLESGWYAPPDTAAPGGGVLLGPVSLLDDSGCTTGGIVAFDEDGHEFARHDAPLCVGDRWIITEDDAPSSS